MRRNMQSYGLADIPSIGIDRSRFKSGWSHTTTFSQGELIPLACKEVLPGSTWSLDMNSLVRMATPVFPVMDNAVMDIWAFWCPNRLVWNHWKEFIGENTEAAWVPQVEYTIPQLKFNLSKEAGAGVTVPYGIPAGSLANHLYGGIGRDLLSYEAKVTDLPNRAYRLIWNEFFRSEAYQDPVFVPLDDNDRSFHSEVDGKSYGEDLLRVNRLPDYFSLALPAPQSGAAVAIPVGGVAPVFTTSSDVLTGVNQTLHWRKSETGAALTGSDWGVLTTPQQGESVQQGTYMQANGFENEGVAVYPSNLAADLSKLQDLDDSLKGTISELRTAFQLQKWLEAYGRSGRRYREILSGIFSVNIPDMTVQVPEYLGGTQFDININQVVQTSSTDDTSPQGNVSAYSMSVHQDHLFKKSFLEHGWVMILGAVRVRHSYVQGLQRQFTRKKLLDHYFPQFANISDQPIFGYERILSGAGAGDGEGYDDTVIGYKEPWSEYRYDLNTVSGQFTPDADGGSLLQPWTFADYIDIHEGYPNPLINGEFMVEPDSNVAQVIAVPSEPQFIANFYFKVDRVLPLPVHSIPGLADHH